MQDLHSMGVDKSSCKAELEEHQIYVHTLTKDSFKKEYLKDNAIIAEKGK